MVKQSNARPARSKIPGKLEKTFVKALGLNAFSISSGPHAIDVKNGKILRIRRLHLDSKYNKEQIAPWMEVTTRFVPK